MRQGSYNRLGLLAALGAACLSCIDVIAPDAAPECVTSADCDQSSGQVCDVGVCWGGDIAEENFAVVLIPPADRSDLAPTEQTSVSIAKDGTVTGLSFAPTVNLHGRVVRSCDEQDLDCTPNTLVESQVIIERASNIPQGPTYRRTVVTKTDVALDEDSFHLALPKDGMEYRITVFPVEDADSPSSARIVKERPLSEIFRADGDTRVDWIIGTADDTKQVEGCIRNRTGNGAAYAGMHVFALGRWEEGGQLQRASAIVRADAQGCFFLRVPIEMRDEFDILVRPQEGVTLPTLRLANEVILDPDPDLPKVHTIAPLVMPNAANPSTFKLPVQGLSPAGTIEPVVNATVVFETTFELAADEERNIDIRFRTQTITNGAAEPEPGVAQVKLYPGSAEVNRDYTVQVFPPPESNFASVFQGTVHAGTGAGAPVLKELSLDRRVLVTGRFLSAEGLPLAHTPFTVRPSFQVRSQLLRAEDQAAVDNLQFASGVTEQDGQFLLWLDPELFQLPAQYDFDLAPPDTIRAPRWTFSAIAMTEALNSTVDLGSLIVPAASYVRGTVRDPQGVAVPAAEVRWFRVPMCETSPCSPAHFLGAWESDGTGATQATLPNL